MSDTTPLPSRELAIYELIKKVIPLTMTEVVTSVDVWQYDELAGDGKAGLWGWQIRIAREYGTGPNLESDTEAARQLLIAALINPKEFNTKVA